MIRAYSQRLLPPFSGQIQIVESDRARALTLDGQMWEAQFVRATSSQTNLDSEQSSVKRSYVRVAMIKDSDIRHNTMNASLGEAEVIDERILELTDYIASTALPFPAADHFEYWLLDSDDQKPLALIFSCPAPEQMKTFPERAEWTALPAAVMPIDRSKEEIAQEYAPINYQLERLVEQRASSKPQAQWFTRQYTAEEDFPPLLLRRDWQDSHSAELCQRYLQRQAPRLLTLHGLGQTLRSELEIYAKSQALEVERFHRLYPEIVDQELIDTIRVEAKLRSVTEGEPAINSRRDGIHYL